LAQKFNINFPGENTENFATEKFEFLWPEFGGWWFWVGGLFIRGGCGGLGLFKVWVSVSMSRIMPPY
jgi:hypothetical protein